MKLFCKANCKWGYRKKGRPQGVQNKNIKRIISKKENSYLCLALDKEHIDYIRKQALMKSAAEGRIIEANELIRDVLKKAFPVPTQYDMFGASK